MATDNGPDWQSIINFLLNFQLVGIILGSLIGIAIGRVNCIHRKRSFLLNLFGCIQECTLKRPCICCEDVRVHFLPDKKEPCVTYINKLTGTGNPNCLYLEGSRRLNTEPNARLCVKLHGSAGEPETGLMTILKALHRAKKRIDLCVFLLTDDVIRRVLVAMKNRGVTVRFITDSKENEEYKRNNQVPKIREAGIKIKTNASAMMHDKFVVIDKRVVILGSANWTANAFFANDEVIVKTRQPVIVERFARKFDQMWAQMPDYSRQPEVRLQMG